MTTRTREKRRRRKALVRWRRKQLGWVGWLSDLGRALFNPNRGPNPNL